jgi:hypothetical protein
MKDLAASRVKKLEWKFWPNGFPPFWEGSTGPFGYYCIEEAARDEDTEYEDPRPLFSITDNFHRHIGVKRSLQEAQDVCQFHFEANVRKVIA